MDYGDLNKCFVSELNIIKYCSLYSYITYCNMLLSFRKVWLRYITRTFKWLNNYFYIHTVRSFECARTIIYI